MKRRRIESNMLAPGVHTFCFLTMVSALSLGIFVISSLNLGLGSNEPLDQHENIVDVLPKRSETAHVDCARLIRGDTGYAKEIAMNRPKLEPVDLGWDCSAIQARILPARNPNTGFPILHARIVNEHYDFLEDQLATNYASENVYCFSLDKKAHLDCMKLVRDKTWEYVILMQDHDVLIKTHGESEPRYKS
ncbi:hypothetical protein PRIPAC_85147 [Pristionchus pacificus]|uniref:Uncharacterized protein n=1 Tax=Pristionchus pacificus TaxID=54126 RepID=A0A2A6BSS5_PRIPA|nr:hypothetical protein PRIPAC_85147 [Pristionchus pacificus]|eukprot:PDM68925.1 hypothetical protein PRIPAC_47227 [Pristionchus pacificus]